MLFAVCSPLLAAHRQPWRTTISGLKRLCQQTPRGSWICLVIAMLTLGPALCYPTGWDELVYHSVLPRRWMTDGAPLVYRDLPYSGFPSLVEILCWLIAPIESVIAPRLLNWCIWIVSLLTLYRLLRLRQVAESTAVLLSCAFAVSPAVLMIGANCYVETIVVLNLTAVLLILETADQVDRIQRTLSVPVVVGIVAAGAASVKLTGLIVLVVPVLWYVRRVWFDRSGFRKWLTCLIVYGVMCIGFVSPFYFRPFLATENPLYPYFNEWLSSDEAAIETSRFHHSIGSSSFGLQSLPSFLTGPVLLAFDENLYDGRLGWQILGMLGLAACVPLMGLRNRLGSDDPLDQGGPQGRASRTRRSSWAMRPAAITTPPMTTMAAQTVSGFAWPSIVFAVLYTFWFLTAQQARFVVPAVVPLILMAGQGVRVMNRTWLRMITGTLIAACVVSLPWRTAGYYAGSWETVLSFWTWEDYVSDGTGGSHLALIQAVRDQTPEDAKLMLQFEHRGLYMPRSHVIGTPFFQETGLSEITGRIDSASIMAQLRRDRITHVIIANSPIGPDRATEWWNRWESVFGGIDDCRQRGTLRLLWASEEHSLLEVVGNGGSYP